MTCNNLNASPSSVEQPKVGQRALASTKLQLSSRIHISNPHTIQSGEGCVYIAIESPHYRFFSTCTLVATPFVGLPNKQ